MVQYLIIVQKSLHNHPPAGLLPRARILVSQVGDYELQILFKTVEKGAMLTEPVTRVESHQCVMWQKLAKNASIFEKDLNEVLCQPCKKNEEPSGSACSDCFKAYIEG